MNCTLFHSHFTQSRFHLRSGITECLEDRNCCACVSAADDRWHPPCSPARCTPTHESWSCYVLLASLGICHFHKERCLLQGTMLSNLVPSDAIQGICHCWYFFMRLRTYRDGFGSFCFLPFLKVVQACLCLEQKCVRRLGNGEMQ